MKKVINFKDMTYQQKRIVKAGNKIAYTLPQGLTKRQMMEWLKNKFGKEES